MGRKDGAFMAKYRIRTRIKTQWQKRLEKDIRKFNYDLKRNSGGCKKTEKVDLRGIEKYKIQKEMERLDQEYKNALNLD